MDDWDRIYENFMAEHRASITDDELSVAKLTRVNLRTDKQSKEKDVAYENFMAAHRESMVETEANIPQLNRSAERTVDEHFARVQAENLRNLEEAIAQAKLDQATQNLADQLSRYHTAYGRER